jgi:hypothetical protein
MSAVKNPILRALLIIILLSFFPVNLFSQILNTTNGYIINHAKDTIKGTFSERTNSDTIIRFRPYNQNEYENIRPKDIIGFFAGKFYESITIPTDSARVEYKFLQVLTKGKIDFYKTDDHQYVAIKNGEVFKLKKQNDIIKQIDINDNNFTKELSIEDKSYVGVLKLLFIDSNKDFAKAELIQYSESSLTRAVNSYNNRFPEEEISNKFQKEEKVYTIGLRGTYLVNDMDNFPKQGIYSSQNFLSKPGFSAGFFTEFPLFWEIKLRPELNLTNRRSYLYVENPFNAPPEVLNFNMYFMEIPVVLVLDLPVKIISPSIFAGGLVGIKIKDKSELQSIFPSTKKVEKDESGFRLGCGLTFKRKSLPVFRLEYYFEQTTLNIFSDNLRYHNNANNISCCFFLNIK